MDDIIITGSNTESQDKFVKKLNRIYALKDLGSLHYFLAIEVVRYDAGMLRI